MYNSVLADGEFLVCMQDHCRSCQGVGVVKGNREVRVDIPAGKSISTSSASSIKDLFEL